jgi:hypothetical protein
MGCWLFAGSNATHEVVELQVERLLEIDVRRDDVSGSLRQRWECIVGGR